MKEYDVAITETLKMTVTVEADSPEEAEQKASDNWHNSEYILDADNFTGVDFAAKHKNRSRDYER
ncbi:MAG: DpnD/PcfM family protein [Oscillospiraceae bacterium]|nr:DpnD/PcfM family protein [Oscillospiraceae bacterium]